MVQVSLAHLAQVVKMDRMVDLGELDHLDLLDYLDPLDPQERMDHLDLVDREVNLDPLGVKVALVKQVYLVSQADLDHQEFVVLLEKLA